MMKYPKLSSSFNILDLQLRNRTVMTAMAVSLAEYDGNPSKDIIEFYTLRAKGGVGLIITEFTRVQEDYGITAKRQLSLSCDELIEGHKRLVDSVHKEGAAIFSQLHHPGRQTYTKYTNTDYVLSASDVPCGLCRQDTRAMTISQVREICDSFIDAAIRAKKSGYDGVELHAAHGYLLEQFLSSYTNNRRDNYGGDLYNRCRLVIDIIKGIHQKCGEDFPISVRMDADECLHMAGISNKGINLEESIEMAKLFEEAGANLLNISTGCYETVNTIVEPASFKEGWRSGNVAAIKKAVTIPVMGNALIRHPEYGEMLLLKGEQDLISMGRPFLADAKWVNKALSGREDEIIPCISCLHCFETLIPAFGSGDPVCCSVNPMTGHEVKYSNPQKVNNKEKVAVVGGGPAGLNVASMLSERGFEVDLYEANTTLGGQLLLAGKPPYKERINEYTRALIINCKNAKVNIILDKRVSEKDLIDKGYYGVVLALGSQPKIFDIPGIKQGYTSEDILSGKVNVHGEKVVVVGGSETGLETALYLAEKENDVTLIEAKEIGENTYFQNLYELTGRLSMAGVSMLPHTKLLEITSSFVKVMNTKSHVVSKIPTNLVVICLGREPVKISDKQLRDAGIKVYTIGDSFAPGRIHQATRSAKEISLIL